MVTMKLKASTEYLTTLDEVDFGSPSPSSLNKVPR